MPHSLSEDEASCKSSCVWNMNTGLDSLLPVKYLNDSTKSGGLLLEEVFLVGLLLFLATQNLSCR